MFGKRDITPWGVDKTIFGYINDKKFIFTDIEYEFNLDGGEVVDFHCMQTGGFCMVDYIEMENGYVYTLNDEFFCRYNDKETFIGEFEEQELDFFDCVKKGLIISQDLEVCKPRSKKDLIKQEKIYQAWAKENTKEEVEV